MKKTVVMILLVVLVAGFGAVSALAGSKVEVQNIAFYERDATANAMFASEIRDVFQTAFLKRLKENGMEVIGFHAPVKVKITISYISSRDNDARLLVAKMSIYKERGSSSSLEISQLVEGVIAPETISEEMNRILAARLARVLAKSCADEISVGAYKEEM